MRQKRAKTYRKLMHLYTLAFHFREPYQVLVDSTMCKTAVELKYNLVKQLGVVLQGEVKPMITQCCIHELYLQGKTMQPVVDLAKAFERRKCNHREVIPGDDCILSVVGEGNKHRYVVASQSHPLRVKLRNVPGVPLLHINRAVLILEPPSDATLKAKEAAVGKALHAPAHDLPYLESSLHQDPLRKKRKGPKGPNPLSIKKKKIKPAAIPVKKNMEEITPKVIPKRKRDDGDSGDDVNQATTQRKRRRKSHSSLETRVNSSVQTTN